jgi:enoyl-CoA hydratase/carnithine racemase
MAKMTDPDTSKAVKKQSNSHADDLALLKKMQSQASHTGLVQMVFDVPPETKAKLEKLARESGMSLSQVAGIILEAQITKHKKLEEEIRRTVSEAMQAENRRFEEELARINAPTETLNNLLVELFPQVKSKMKKGVTN